MISANQLTILRMVFVPIFVLLIVYDYFGGALAIFLLAGVTDLLDGLIARKFGQKTPIGTFLDPVADKLLLAACFVLLSRGSAELMVQIPLWLTITVIGRDALLVISIVIINLTMGRHLFPPSIYGKATTAVQLLTVLIVLVINYLKVAVPWVRFIFYLTFALTVISGMHYLARGMKLVEYDREEMEEIRGVMEDVSPRRKG
ncbi:CDP-alcohol phosphatidyltransferase family protein [Acidobacteria bacterium AH-259-D05]|nr:CDP-alcohol phosphatidyltransferase family protein [Acidobacteria bacterium AH-259-D05]